jgi:hypothetical protein
LRQFDPIIHGFSFFTPTGQDRASPVEVQGDGVTPQPQSPPKAIFQPHLPAYSHRMLIWKRKNARARRETFSAISVHGMGLARNPFGFGRILIALDTFAWPPTILFGQESLIL